jgi:hypothetical protein
LGMGRGFEVIVGGRRGCSHRCEARRECIACLVLAVVTGAWVSARVCGMSGWVGGCMLSLVRPPDAVAESTVPELLPSPSHAGIPAWNSRLERLYDRFSDALLAASPDFQTKVGYGRDPPGAANLMLASKQVCVCAGVGKGRCWQLLLAGPWMVHLYISRQQEGAAVRAAG